MAQETVTKQKNPLRIEQGRKSVECNKRKKEELKQLNEQITKQDDMADHKPKPDMNNYVYASGRMHQSIPTTNILPQATPGVLHSILMPRDRDLYLMTFPGGQVIAYPQNYI